MVTVKNSKYVYLLLFSKYVLLLFFIPELEYERFYDFYNVCTGLCLDPYVNIQYLPEGSLSFHTDTLCIFFTSFFSYFQTLFSFFHNYFLYIY